MDYKIYQTPKNTEDIDKNYNFLLKLRRKAFALTALAWSAPIILVIIKIPLIATIIAGCYSIVILFFAMAAAEVYKEKAKKLGLDKHAFCARLLFLFNCLPFILAIGNLLLYFLRFAIQ